MYMLLSQRQFQLLLSLRTSKSLHTIAEHHLSTWKSVVSNGFVKLNGNIAMLTKRGEIFIEFFTDSRHVQRVKNVNNERIVRFKNAKRKRSRN